MHTIKNNVVRFEKRIDSDVKYAWFVVNGLKPAKHTVWSFSCTTSSWRTKSLYNYVKLFQISNLPRTKQESEQTGWILNCSSHWLLLDYCCHETRITNSNSRCCMFCFCSFQMHFRWSYAPSMVYTEQSSPKAKSLFGFLFPCCVSLWSKLTTARPNCHG